LAQAQRTAKEFAQFLVEGGSEADLLVAGFAEHEVFATPHGHAVVAGLGDGTLRADLHTGGAKDAPTEIECDRFARRARNGFGRAHGHAGVASVGTFAGIDLECAAVAVRRDGSRALG
jgi:hypothetical protein